MNFFQRVLAATFGGILWLSAGASEFAHDAQTVEDLKTPSLCSLTGQATYVGQGYRGFSSRYSGSNSLASNTNSNETIDLSALISCEVMPHLELVVNPEIDQGFGLSNSLGAAGFPSAEAYKIGAHRPYYRTPRMLIRKTWFIESEDSTTQRLGENPSREAQQLILTIGKFSVVDVFDTNRYAHDARNDFLNWTMVDAGAFDYAADAWGYTQGASLEWSREDWTLRSGWFALSVVPNSESIDQHFKQYEWVEELEHRHTIGGLSGSIKLLGFLNKALMGSYEDAITLAAITHSTPSTALVRKEAVRTGVSLNIEQALSEQAGFFSRISMNDGSKETYEFTDVNWSVLAGFSWKGGAWHRPEDTLGVAQVVNGIYGPARRYFDAGGLGLLVGDGLLNYGTERVSELFYNWQVCPGVIVGLNEQYLVHPAYNRDRGPINVLALRLHLDY